MDLIGISCRPQGYRTATPSELHSGQKAPGRGYVGRRCPRQTGPSHRNLGSICKFGSLSSWLHPEFRPQPKTIMIFPVSRLTDLEPTQNGHEGGREAVTGGVKFASAFMFVVAATCSLVDTTSGIKRGFPCRVCIHKQQCLTLGPPFPSSSLQRAQPCALKACPFALQLFTDCFLRFLSVLWISASS